MGLSVRSFAPVNNWNAVDGDRWAGGEPLYVTDGTRDGTFLNIGKTTLRIASGVKAITTPISAIGIAAALAFDSISCFFERSHGPRYNFTARVITSVKDIARVVAIPLTVVGLEFAAIYGIVRPNDGRKLYSSIERLGYGIEPVRTDELPLPLLRGENRNGLMALRLAMGDGEMPVLPAELDAD